MSILTPLAVPRDGLSEPCPPDLAYKQPQARMSSDPLLMARICRHREPEWRRVHAAADPYMLSFLEIS